MVANESQRLAYLRVMGVQPYFPRRPLAGAKPVQNYSEGFLRQNSSVELEHSQVPASAQDVLTLLVAKPSADRLQQRENIAPKPSVDVSPLDRVAETTEQSIATTAVQEPVTLEPVSVQVEQDVRFVFAYFPINEHFAVLNELPWGTSANVSASCRKLLADILKALGVEVPERNLNPMVFTWPLFEGAPTDLNSENARQTLEGFVAKRLRLLPVKTLLVLAEQSAQFLFPAGFQANQQASFKHPRHDVEVVITHSLNAMEAVPDLKRPVWKTLQPLRGQLTGKNNASQDGVS